MIYAGPNSDEPLTQGDVFDGCPVYGIKLTGTPVDLAASPIRWEQRVVVVSQACDLINAKARDAVVAVVHTAQAVVERGELKASTVRDQIRRGLAFGWYFLPTAQAPIPIPESLIDFRDLHTVPLPVLARLIADGKRVGRLLTPYREHMAQHFAVTYMRIGLPEPMETEP
jgi:hypothetical protein